MGRPAGLAGAVQGQGEMIGNEYRSVVVQLQFVRFTPVIEARLYLHPEAHRPAHHAHQPNQPVPVGRTALDDRHEVDHLTSPVGGHEPRNQDRGVGEVQLPAHVVVPIGRNTEVPAAVVIEQGREDARRVETRTAEPIDGSVSTDQGCCLQLADQAVLTYFGVEVHRNVLSRRSGCLPPFYIALLELSFRRGSISSSLRSTSPRGCSVLRARVERTGTWGVTGYP